MSESTKCDEGAQLYHEGQRLWIPCSEQGWQEGTVMAVDGTKLSVKSGGGQVIETKGPVHIAGAPQNETDLQNIRPLHDASVMENIRVRFREESFYTYTGKSLIAINPMKPVAELYDRAHILKYNSIQELCDIHLEDPHIYAAGETAFRQMIQTQSPQSVIVSGESGAGKTVTSRYLLQYFTIVAALAKEREDAEHESSATSLINSRPATPPQQLQQQQQQQPPTAMMRHHSSVHALHERKGEMEAKIIVSNTLLEAFGNATTLRNENSSRFGKYLRLQFGHSGAVCGASVQTYLLERSRVVHHSPGERAFHVFYQLLHGASDEEKVKFRLKKSSVFQYTQVTTADTASSTGATVATGVASKKPQVRQNTPAEDVKEMAATRKAFKDLGVPEKVQSDVFQVLAAILHLGQIDINQLVAKRVDETADNNSLAVAAQLLGVEPSKLAHMLKHRRITARGEVFYSPTSCEEAAGLRDSFAKALYLALFLWVVDQVNFCTSADSHRNYIGILDIYGFECFAENDLEQLCINYANEKLQQQSVGHIFKEEQLLYEREGIAWSFVEYADNSPCLDLLEGPGGVISLLNEQSSLKRAADPEAFTTRLYQEHAADAQFGQLKAGPSTCQFTVKHYAMDVTYSTGAFIGKNLDDINTEFVELVQSSPIEFVHHLFEQPDLVHSLHLGNDTPSRGRKGPSTVMSRFKSSLNDLMDMLNSTTPHYIRCIKPNYEQSGYLSSSATTVQPEATLQKLGHKPSLPSIITTAAPVRRRGGGRATGDATEPNSTLASKDKHLHASNGSIGKRSSLKKKRGAVDRTDQIVFDGKHVLEQLHGAGIIDIVRISQAGYPYRFDYEEFVDAYWPIYGEAVLDESMDLRVACKKICACIPGESSPDNVQEGMTMLFLRSNEMYALDHLLHQAITRAAVTIQSWWRAINIRIMIGRWRKAVVVLQRHVRMVIARNRYQREKSACLVLQTRWRGHRARRLYIEQRNAAVAIQSNYKALTARHSYLLRRTAVIVIQTRIRGVQARRAYLALLERRVECAVFLQAHIRDWLEVVRERNAVNEQIAQLQLTIALLQGGASHRKRSKGSVTGSHTSLTPRSIESPFSSKSGKRLSKATSRPKLLRVGEDESLVVDNKGGTDLVGELIGLPVASAKSRTKSRTRAGLTQKSLDNLDNLVDERSSIDSMGKSTFINIVQEDVTDVYLNIPSLSDLLLQGVKIHLSNSALDMFRVSINIMDSAKTPAEDDRTTADRENEIRTRLYVQSRLAMCTGDETALKLHCSQGLLGVLDSETIRLRAQRYLLEDD